MPRVVSDAQHECVGGFVDDVSVGEREREMACAVGQDEIEIPIAHEFEPGSCRNRGDRVGFSFDAWGAVSGNQPRYPSRSQRKRVRNEPCMSRLCRLLRTESCTTNV